MWNWTGTRPGLMIFLRCIGFHGDKAGVDEPRQFDPHHRPHHETKKGGDGNLGDKGDGLHVQHHKKKKTLAARKTLRAVYETSFHCTISHPLPCGNHLLSFFFFQRDRFAFGGIAQDWTAAYHAMV